MTWRHALLFCLFFLLPGSALADFSIDPGASTDSQPFTFYCDTYQSSFQDGGYYSILDGRVCHYTIPQTTAIGKVFEIYNGTVGSSSLLDSFVLVNNPATSVSTLPNVFNQPALGITSNQGDDLFTVEYSVNTAAEMASAQSYFESGAGSAPAGYSSLAWKWGIAPTTTCTENCYSNVMFLPGIESSRLFAPASGGENKIWEPDSVTGNDTPALDLNNPNFQNNVYTKQNEIIDSAYFGFYKVYSSFIDTLNSLKTRNLISDWEPIAYDWRLDYQSLLTTGNQQNNGHIYYRGNLSATSTPYIIQELKRLAATSKTGKVTIIAHSNGGLLAKALLEQPGIDQYVDKVIFVAVPQFGTPVAIGGLLHGFDQGFKFLNFQIFSDADARFLGKNLPMSYNLLPSTQYFNDISTPVVTFDQNTLPDWVQKYGASITTSIGLRNFMIDQTRVAPSYSDVATPIIASSTLFDLASETHKQLDAWAPPMDIQFITIAGWGNETLSGITYKKVLTQICQRSIFGRCIQYIQGTRLTFDPQIVIEGDGTVVEPSASFSINQTTHYWVNLMAANVTSNNAYLHANILELPELRTLLSNLITNSTLLPNFISSTLPQYNGSEPRLYFVAHSPVTLGFVDIFENYTGLATSSLVLSQIPGVFYEHLGEVQFLSVPKSMPGQLILQGTGSGSLSLDIEEVNGDAITSQTTFEGIPVSTSSVIKMLIDPAQSPTATGTLKVDEDGNGTSDILLSPKQNGAVVPDCLQESVRVLSSPQLKLLLSSLAVKIPILNQILDKLQSKLDDAGCLKIPIKKV